MPRARTARRPKQQRSEETRRLILEEAERLFARDGFAAASLNELAERLGIHKPGIFYYFPSKRALYEAVVEEALGALREEVAALLGSARSPRARILDAARHWVEAMAARPTLARLLLHEAANPDSTATPRTFADVGQEIRALLEEPFRCLCPDATDDDLFYYFSLLTGTTLFYASAMGRMMSGRNEPESRHSMEHLATRLDGTTRDLLKRLRASSAG